MAEIAIGDVVRLISFALGADFFAWQFFSITSKIKVQAHTEIVTGTSRGRKECLNYQTAELSRDLSSHPGIPILSFCKIEALVQLSKFLHLC